MVIPSQYICIYVQFTVIELEQLCYNLSFQPSFKNLAEVTQTSVKEIGLFHISKGVKAGIAYP